MNNQQHLDEIHQNHRAWQKKTILRVIYRRFHRRIASLLKTSDVPTIEIGSGIGKIVEVINDCVRTDLFPNPWIDQVENAYKMSFDNESVSNIILFDVWHHLKYPGTALEEFQRVLIPGGRVIVMEPCMSLLGMFVYGFFHPEPLGWFKPGSWTAPSQMAALQQGYYAAQANAHRHFVRKSNGGLDAWHTFHQERIPGWAYFATGGFSGPQLCNARTLPFFDALDRLCHAFPAFFACRLLVGLEKPEA